MRSALGLVLLAVWAAAAAAEPVQPAEPPESATTEARVFYVRQEAGDDRADGTSPEAAWQSLSRLSGALAAGDTAYVGPGLYRDQLVLRSGGSAERRIRVLADPSGAHTGDRPGLVMVSGAEPVDEGMFQPTGPPGVFQAKFSAFVPVGVVEMDGPQFRYMRARSTPEHLQEGLSELEVVDKLPFTYSYDAETETLTLHTSDGAPPSEHELELFRRGAGFSVAGQDYVTIAGFTIRHTGDAGIAFANGSRHGIAIDNVCYGHRIGIRVNGAEDVLVSGNTLFRNENSGVYFLRESLRGRAWDNLVYENVKGVRFGSRSDAGQAVGNAAFRNLEVGISVEDTSGALVLRNRLAHNGDAQLLLRQARTAISDANCFEAAAPEEAIAGLYVSRYTELPAFRQASGQDMGSRVGDCGSFPDALDVRRLQLEAEALLRR
jgi:hypothetical protein